MTRKAQATLDGISVNNNKARFSGTVDLEDVEAEAASLDEVLVMVVVANVKDVQAKLDRTGDLDRINVMKVTDARLLTGELKALLVDKLGLYGADTVPPATITRDVDLTTGEVLDPDDSDSAVFSPAGTEIPDEESYEAREPVAEVSDGVIGHVGRRDPNARPERSGGNGPRTKAYNEDDGGPAVPSGQVLGRIGRPGITSVRSWGEDPE